MNQDLFQAFHYVYYFMEAILKYSSRLYIGSYLIFFFIF